MNKKIKPMWNITRYNSSLAIYVPFFPNKCACCDVEKDSNWRIDYVYYKKSKRKTRQIFICKVCFSLFNMVTNIINENNVLYYPRHKEIAISASTNPKEICTSYEILKKMINESHKV